MRSGSSDARAVATLTQGLAWLLLALVVVSLLEWARMLLWWSGRSILPTRWLAWRN